MKTVSCFGHSMCPAILFPKILDTIQSLLVNDPDTEFLVGNQGEFDGMVYRALKMIEKQNPDIRYKVVLAYLPGKKEENALYPAERTYYPEGLELVHPRFAISMRNRWMVDQCDIILCYITHTWGGAQQFVHQAVRKRKEIINIAEMYSG